MLKGVDTDWTRYQGLWFEQARVPSWFESKDQGNVTAMYSAVPNKPKEIQVENRSVNIKTGKLQTAKGNAYIDDKRPGILRVKFIWIQPRADYIVIAHDPEYQWSLVGSRNRNQLWLLTRNPMPVTTEFLLMIHDLARTNGYSEAVLSKFERTPRSNQPYYPRHG